MIGKKKGLIKMANNKINSKRQKCEVYTRIVGYLRPVDQWNPGKRAELKDRKMFNTKKIKGLTGK